MGVPAGHGVGIPAPQRGESADATAVPHARGCGRTDPTPLRGPPHLEPPIPGQPQDRCSIPHLPASRQTNMEGKPVMLHGRLHKTAQPPQTVSKALLCMCADDAKGKQGTRADE